MKHFLIQLLMPLVAICLLQFSPSLASADIFVFSANLSGDQEVPPSGSLGTGFATVTFDDTTSTLGWDISWSGLSGPATAMHFHNAPAGINGGVVVNIGAISGLTSPSIGSTVISNSLANELFADNLYINVHTAQFPGGEIRGQVVPEPSGLLAIGIAAMAVASRRRKR